MSDSAAAVPGSYREVFPSLDDAELVRLAAPPMESQPSGTNAAASHHFDDADIHLSTPTIAVSEQELEERYAALSICLRSDRRTTATRLERLRRKRDQSETNMMAELAKCREAVKQQAPATAGAAAGAAAGADVQMQLLVAAARAAVNMVEAAEAYGAVQQEARVVNALDQITQYVESLRRVHARLREEHRSLLAHNNISPQNEPTPRTSRYGSLSAAPHSDKKAVGSKRRASIAALPRSGSMVVAPGPGYGPGYGPGSTTAGPLPGFDETPLRFNGRLGHGGNRRVSLQPRNSMSLGSVVAAAAEATVAAASALNGDSFDSSDRRDSRIDCGMADITELSESRRESAAGRTDDEGGMADAHGAGGRRLSRRKTILSAASVDDSDSQTEIDDAGSEDDEQEKAAHLRYLQSSVIRARHGLLATIYLFFVTEVLGTGMDAISRRLSDLRRNSYRMVRMSVSCCLLAAAAAVLLSTLFGAGGGGTSTAQRGRQ